MSVISLNRYFLVPSSLILLSLITWFGVASDLLPNPIAIHWGITGLADGFSSAESYLVMLASVLGGIWVIQLTIFFFVKNSPLIRLFLESVVVFVYWLIFLILLSATLVQFSVTDASDADFPITLIIGLLAMVPLLIWFTLAMPSVSVDKDVTIRLRGLKVLTIGVQDIQKVELEMLSPWNFGGLGVRVSGRTLAFIPSKGQAVALTLLTGERVAIRSNKAHELLSALNAQLKG